MSKNISVEEALNVLRENGLVFKVWVEEDVEGRINEEWEGSNLTPNERSLIVNEAINTRYWDALGDCTDMDWSLVDSAISEAADNLNIEL